MFPNNGPVSAQQVVRTYIATVGLTNFPEEARAAFVEINTMPVFEAMSLGVERLYAALRELELPDRGTALAALGGAAQAAASSNVDNKSDRWWAIVTWAASEIEEPGGEHSVEPDVDVAHSFLPRPEPEGPPAV